MKKSFYTAVAIGAAILISGHDDAEASTKTYKVQSGDNLSTIALKHNTSIANLKKWNKLKTDIIYANQTLIVANSSNSKTVKVKSTKQSSASNDTYTVKNGDFLYSIATKHKLTVDQLRDMNNLKTNIIYVGQKLKVSGKTTKTVSTKGKTTKVKTTKAKVTAKPKVIKTSNKITSTHTVVNGDYLSKIAVSYNMSTETLKSLNGLKSDMIYVGQKLKVTGKITAVSSTTKTPATKTPTTPKATTSTKTSSTYTVVSGDYLSKIAASYNMSTATLKALNNMTTDNIYIGQKLKVTGKATAVSSTNTSKKPVVSSPTKPVSNASSTSNLITNAKKHLNTPYVWGGSNPNGFDCSGFVYYVFNQSGKSLTRTNAVGYYNLSTKTTNPKVGDIVFFKNTYAAGITHLGIYMGNDMFIHAGGDKVQISSVNESYWKSHFAGYGSI